VNRGANFNPNEASNTKPLATTGLHVGLPVTGGLLIATALLLATRRRRRTT
jgi:LPXTG-motif cell wall-anchored protein